MIACADKECGYKRAVEDAEPVMAPLVGAEAAAPPPA